VSPNIGNGLPLYAAYPTRLQISHDNLVMQALVWLRTFSSEWSSLQFVCKF